MYIYWMGAIRITLLPMELRGKRISELLQLELRNIDLERWQIQIRQGKGRKDLYVVLAESMVPLLLN